MNASQYATENITLDVLCSLSWHYFDALWILEAPRVPIFGPTADLCDSTGMYMVSIGAPVEYKHPGHWWARFDSLSLADDGAFIKPDSLGESIDSVLSAPAMMGAILDDLVILDTCNVDRPAVWYYDIFNEGPGHQYANRIDTSLYSLLSLAGKADAGANTWVYVDVFWTDENSNDHSVRLPDSLTASWSEMGPYDLSDLSEDWDDGDATALWLEFSRGDSLSRDIRLGWIRLTE